MIPVALFVFIFSLLLVAYGFLIEKYRHWWNEMPLFTPSRGPKAKVSVIIAVRNEENNISPLFASLQALQYPRDLFQVIVVDDHSEDGTRHKLEDYVSGDMKVILLENGPYEYY